MAQCTEVKANGERCRGTAGADSEYCWAHDPKHADKRSRRASIASRSQGGVPSPGAIARRVLETIARLEAGTLEAKDAAVLFQGHNVLRSLAKLEDERRTAAWIRADFYGGDPDEGPIQRIIFENAPTREELGDDPLGRGTR